MQRLRDAPLVKSGYSVYFFLLFVSGVLVSFYFGQFLFYAMLAVGLALLLGAFHRSKASFIFAVVGLSLGLLGGAIKINPKKLGSGEYRGLVKESRRNYFLFESDFATYYVYDKNSAYEPGDILLIKGSVTLYEGKEYESRFSFADYLAKKGVRYSLKAYSIENKFLMPLRIREKEISFLANFTYETRSAIDSLAFGYNDYDSDYVSEASGVGMLYLLSASGLIFGAFLRFVQWLFSLRGPRATGEVASFLAGSLMLPFLYWKVGIWRVLLTRLARLIYAKKGVKPPPGPFVSALVGSLMLLFNPLLALNSGFFLGFGISLYSSYDFPFFVLFGSLERKRAQRLFLLLLILPLQWESGAFRPFAGLFSLVSAPLTYPFAFLSYLSYFSVPFTRLLEGYRQILGFVLGGLSRLDFVIPLGPKTIEFTYCYYLGLVLILFFREFGFWNVSKKIMKGLGLAVAINGLPLGNIASQEVSFINVGQGDAIFIRDGFTNVLIDTGGNISFDLAEEVDIPFFRNNRIYSLDYVIASHGDYDHIGAYESLKENFPVKHYVSEKEDFPLDVGSLHFENLNLYGGSEENMESLVLTLDFMGKKWLFAGDAPIEIEKKIIADHPELDCDILKLGHHGSKTSSSETFLKTITPELAIISVGKNNSYGHPDQEVLTRLNELSIPYRRTDEEGTIRFSKYFSTNLDLTTMGQKGKKRKT